MNKIITLKSMTLPLCHRLFRFFTADPAVFREGQPFREYQYSAKDCDGYYHRQQALGRIHLAIMLNDQVIGEIILKNIDREQRSCVLSIHLMNDSLKDRGYGTAAVKLAIRHAFENEKFRTVYADALKTNTRSRHVLKKAGFREVDSDETYTYYVCTDAEAHNGAEPV